MITKRLKEIIEEFRQRSVNTEAITRELEWSQIFHDTIRGRQWLQDLPLSPGRWAANYSLLYVLVRILAEYTPKKILEFGLGESSKIISEFLKNELKESSHTIIEHSAEWVSKFNQRYQLSPNSNISLHNVEIVRQNNAELNVYTGLDQYSNVPFDFYLVDGISSNSNSRSYIINIASQLSSANEFIIIVDDTHRKAEAETFAALEKTFHEKGISIFSAHYHGSKSQSLVATSLYRFATTL